MDFEPMDVDKSASSASKMDISLNDTDSDVYVLDNDDISVTGNSTTMKEVPEVRNNIIFTTFNNTTMKIKNEPPEDLPTKQESLDEFFESNQDVPAPAENTKPKSSPKQRKHNKVKTYHIKKNQHLKKAETKYIYLTPVVLVLLLSILTYYQIINFNCAEEIDLRLLRKSFTENLFGQSAATNKIIETLNIEDRSKIIFLYGGTGVGKTLAVSLILDKLWNSANVYHYTMPTFPDTFSPELMFGLTVCKTSLIVVDDLTRSDMHINSHIKNVITKSENLGKNITIFLVYNCDNVADNFVKKCDSSFHKELEQSFQHIDVEKYFIQFEPLQQEHLRKCIENELGNRKVSKQEMNNILKNFDVSLDGCKGVYTKIKYLNFI